MEPQLTEMVKVWPKIKAILGVPHNQVEYKRLVLFLDHLLDEVGENESHPMASLVETLGSLVETFEEKKMPETKGNSVETLKFLMEEHGLTQSDLPEIGSQGVVSEILKGHRKLNIRQIKALSRRFHVSPAVFIP